MTISRHRNKVFYYIIYQDNNGNSYLTSGTGMYLYITSYQIPRLYDSLREIKLHIYGTYRFENKFIENKFGDGSNYTIVRLDMENQKIIGTIPLSVLVNLNYKEIDKLDKEDTLKKEDEDEG